jgi:hypothetical protein
MFSTAFIVDAAEWWKEGRRNKSKSTFAFFYLNELKNKNTYF